MFCTRCGKAIDDQAAFCPACGQAVQPGQDQVPAYTADQQKSKLVGGLLGILLGSFGAGRFYLGYTTIGVLQLVVSIITCGVGSIWGLIDGIMILAGNVKVDAKNIPLKD